MDGYLAGIGRRQVRVDDGGTGLLPCFACAGATDVVGRYGTAYGDGAAEAEVANSRDTCVTARCQDVRIGYVRESCLIFRYDIACRVFGFTDDGFCIAAAMVDGYGPAEGDFLAGADSGTDSIECASIGSGDVEVDAARCCQALEGPAGEVGVDLVRELVVRQGFADTGCTAIGDGAGDVYFFGVAVGFDGQFIRNQCRVADLGQDVVGLGLPVYTADTAEVLCPCGNTGRDVDA